MKPSEINAVIRELKKNREDMLPKCKLKIAKRYDNLNYVIGSNVECLNIAGNHWDACMAGTYEGIIYSLPADYPEVPEVPEVTEVTEGWVVVVAVDDKGYVWVDGRCYEWLPASIHAKSESRRVSHFGGYLWESKRSPGQYIMSCVPLGLDAQDWPCSDPSRWVKPLTPKALRFWSTDVAKACTHGFKPWNADEWPKV